MSIFKWRSPFPPPRCTLSTVKCTLQATGRGSEGWLLLGDEVFLPSFLCLQTPLSILEEMEMIMERGGGKQGKVEGRGGKRVSQA